MEQHKIWNCNRAITIDLHDCILNNFFDQFLLLVDNTAICLQMETNLQLRKYKTKIKIKEKENCRPFLHQIS